ncbi:MAG: alpha/beta fold hydrolase [Burkholderiaceae bacterium]|nr:alpha/beta fold hydrolase [Burkholderiaceae bacterium]
MRAILYLHGFRSSPSSFKSRRLHAHFAARGEEGRFICPQLPPSPAEAFACVRALVDGKAADAFAVVGSSLGGFYATALAEATGCRAVLINPAVWPARDLAAYIGEQQAWHSDQRFFFRSEYIAELEALTVARITQPQRYLLLAATGDEVLDWREMTARYGGANQRVIDGSDHGLSDFDDYIDEVVGFCER